MGMPQRFIRGECATTVGSCQQDRFAGKGGRVVSFRG